MRRVAGILAVLAVATAGGLWIARTNASAGDYDSLAPVEARAITATVAPTTTTTIAPDQPATVAPLAGPFQVAYVKAGGIEVHKTPGGPVLKALSNPLYGTLPLVFLTRYPARDGWIEVHLPVRPNQSVGFIKADEVTLKEVGVQILVEQRFRRLTVWDGGRMVFETPVAIGKAKTPTPNGTYYVQGNVYNPGPAYGPVIMALSSHSDVHFTFGGGDGLVGIHGTNQPGLIGQAVSNGCIRLPNAAAAQVAKLVPPGAPVTVVP